jgi:hypothetical protein
MTFGCAEPGDAIPLFVLARGAAPDCICAGPEAVAKITARASAGSFFISSLGFLRKKIQ